MKKIKFLIISIFALIAASCSYNPAELTDKLTDFKDRIAKLQTRIESMNAQLEALETITAGNVITAVEVDANGNYLIKYKDSKNEEKAVVIALQDQMLNVPLLGVKQDETNGLYYWTLGNDFLLGADGQKVAVNGKTPTVTVDAEGYWLINGSRVNDANGLPIEANDGESCVFKGIAKNAEGDLVVTLGNGEVITIPVQDVLNLTLSAPLQYTVADPTAPMNITYEVVGQNAANAIVAVAEVTEGIKAEINRETKTITLTFDSSFNGGHVIVVANDMADHTVLRPVFLEKMKDPRVFINNAAELVAFAEAVNGGNTHEGMQVFLNADIDMKDVAWTPIGNGTFASSTVGGPVFSGTFDGQGHSVKNLVINNQSVVPNGVVGLFGIIQDATVKNVTLGEGSSFNVKGSTETAACSVGGVVAVAVGETLVENCVNYASIAVNQPVTKTYAQAGVVGYAYASGAVVLVQNCKNHGELTSESLSTNNGGNGLQLAGIVGYSDTSGAEAGQYLVQIKNCENTGLIEGQSARMGGIAGILNRGILVSGCKNSGNIINTNIKANNRNGGIAGMMNNASKIENCVNTGNVTFNVEGNKTHGYVAGIVAQMGTDGDIVDGCENYGTIRSDIIKGEAGKQHIAIICSNTNKKANSIKNCKVGGKIGPLVEEGVYSMTTIDADNYASYIFYDGNVGTQDPVLENNVFAGEGTTTPDPDPETGGGSGDIGDVEFEEDNNKE